jgi:hypothetical protein
MALSLRQMITCFVCASASECGSVERDVAVICVAECRRSGG